MPEFLEEIDICEDRARAQSGQLSADDYDEIRADMEAAKMEQRMNAGLAV